MATKGSPPGQKTNTGARKQACAKYSTVQYSTSIRPYKYLQCEELRNRVQRKATADVEYTLWSKGLDSWLDELWNFRQLNQLAPNTKLIYRNLNS